MSEPTNDPLDAVQRARAVAAYEVGRMVLGEDPMPEDVITIADWIVTGRRPVLTRTTPTDEQVRAAARRVTDEACWQADSKSEVG